MRFVPSAMLVLSILGAACVGCSAESQTTFAESAPAQNDAAKASTAAAASKPAQTAEAFTVRGSINDTTMAAQAHHVDILALAADGTTTKVATTSVDSSGGFQSPLTGDQSPTGIFILSIKTIGDDILGSSLVDGALPLAKGIIIDAPVDTLTSFKTNILQNIASKKAPNLQNYINVIEAFINSELLNGVEVDDALSTDGKTLISASSDAIIAGENVITSTLQSAGINVDLSALQSAQQAVVTGLDNGIDTGKNDTITVGATLVSGIEGAIKNAVAPVDQALFNSIANGGAAFANTMKQGGVSDSAAFAASKASFSLQTKLSTSKIRNSFAQANVSSSVTDALTQASNDFTSAVGSATSVDDLQTAKTNFMNVLAGSSSSGSSSGSAPGSCIYDLLCTVVTDVRQAFWSYFDSTIQPLCADLESAFSSGDYGKIGAALTAFDQGSASWEANMPGLTGDTAKSFSNAVRFVQKQIPQ